tara:strand:- start:865 stop:1950 length:1086 start_codon:yes stop_codon:yes gene_type:complete
MPLVPPYIKKLKSYKPGKSISEAKRELGIESFIKVASNENPLGPSPRGIEAIQQSFSDIHRYPDATGYELRKKLATKFNVHIGNVVLGAGSEGIMSTIMRTFLLNDDELISAANSFIGFRVLANASGRKVHWVPMKNYRYDLKGIAKKINDYTKIIYIANPDNPMGTTITREEFDEFYKHVPERVLIILDEAYYEFARNIPSYPDSMNYRYDNIITLRTFSKAYGLAGIRLGYGFAHDSLIENLMKVKVPFEPSLIAQSAGIAAIDDDLFLNETISINANGLNFLKHEFQKMKIKQVPSCANFITTIWESNERATEITEALLGNGVIVRQLNGFGWPNCIRISVGLETENQKCINSLLKIL